jgi:peptide/nickel transport system substrate-binding protein
LGVACLGLVIAQVGCGSKKDAPTALPQDSSSPRHGGHIVLPSNEPDRLNPALQTRFDRATPLIFEGLVGLDANLAVQPRLAESWVIAPDSKAITFRLRRGVKWHDGQPFTAADVAFTFETIRATEEPTVWKGYMANVETVETPDDHTVVVRYGQPYGPALVSWEVGIIPRHAYSRGPGSREEPIAVGTGPFRFVRWEPGQRIVLEAHKDYWGGRPYLASVEILLNVPSVAQLDLLKESKLDFVEISDVAVWSQQVHTPEFREHYEVADEVESRFRMIAWNHQRVPFELKSVRLALTLALDRARVIEEVLIGQAQLLSAPFFATMYGADPSVAPHPFDPARATKLLDEARLLAKNGQRFAVELIVRESERSQSLDQMLAIFQRNLRAVDVELKVVFLDTREFFDRIVLREFDAAFIGWVPDIADPDPYALLHSSQINAGPNYAGYANAEVDRLLEEARSLSDREARKALYHEIHALVHAEEPYTLLYAAYGHYAWSRRLHGVNPRDIGTQPRYPGVARWWVTQ